MLPNLSEDWQIHMESGIPNPRFYEVCLHFELKDQETGTAKSKHSGSQKSKNSRIYAICPSLLSRYLWKVGWYPKPAPSHSETTPKLKILRNLSEDQQNLLKCGSPNSRFYAICVNFKLRDLQKLGGSPNLLPQAWKQWRLRKPSAAK